MIISVDMRNYEMCLKRVHDLHKTIPEHIEIMKFNDHPVNVLFELYKIGQNPEFRLFNIHFDKNGVLGNLVPQNHAKSVAKDDIIVTFSIRNALWAKRDVLFCKKGGKPKIDFYPMFKD